MSLPQQLPSSAAPISAWNNLKSLSSNFISSMTALRSCTKWSLNWLDTRIKPRSRHSAFIDCESMGTMMRGALIFTFRLSRVAFSYALTTFFLAASAAAAEAEAIACWAAWKWSRKF